MCDATTAAISPNTPALNIDSKMSVGLLKELNELRKLPALRPSTATDVM